MTVKLKAGAYYIGDPCYIFDKSWGDILDITDYFQYESNTINGMECFIHSTSYGDGIYYDNFGKAYAVDAGVIGCLPIDCIIIDNKSSVKEIEEDSLMHIKVFEKDFECSYKDGRFYIGDDIIINTQADYESEEDEEELWND